MVDKDHKRFMKGNRSINDVHHRFVEDCTKANIGPTSTFNLLKEFFGGYDVVGCTLNDVRNCSRDIKEKLKQLVSLFWSDAESRKHYHMFGDVVAFDTTYSTNRYRMVLGPFTGKDNFIKEFRSCVWSELLDDIDILWTDIVEKYGVEIINGLRTYFTLQYNNAIDAQRNQTERLDYYDSIISPKYVIDLAFEKQLTSVYTDRIHLFFVLRKKDVNNIPEKYVGNRWLKSELLKAVHGLTSDESASDKGSNKDDKLHIGNRCHGRYFGLHQRAFRNKNHLIALDNVLAGIGPQIFTDDTTGSSLVDKNDSIMNIYGVVVPEEITAHAPDVVSSKGGASDKKSMIKSSIEKAIEKANKLHRRCAKCHKVTDHNARSCGKKQT
ncbi:uncharacterized protein LOC121749288 [Salvia splendens]|uniref:uncharacterized protein LOC121749288 n=1 Tax=Salvia splendens TaxID=180675 RepID=UPI001C2697DC|nr:uncharacterized protein LOC121749288 [Salvia splendens]